MEIELKIKSAIRFFLPLFSATLSMFWAFALHFGIGLYEPDMAIADLEALLLMIIAGISIIALYWEVKD